MFDNKIIQFTDITSSFGEKCTNIPLEKHSPVKIIIPSFRSLKGQGELSVADERKNEPSDFIYTSKNNTDWVSIQELHHCIEPNMEIL
jgi:hypothetical protein